MENKQGLVQIYRWLRQYGNNDSHSGNASLREGDRIWLTPTGACADTLSADELVACSVAGACGEGASLDGPLHQLVYQRNPKARADFEGQYYFPQVPVVTIGYDRYVEESPAAVAAVLARHPIMVVRGHGVYAWGETLNLAYKWTCSLELSAKTAMIARQMI